MNKIRVIDLLNKIANGEEVPEKIKYEGDIWKLNTLENTYDNGKCCLFEDYIDKKYVITDVLNDEVEIIEDKKIEPIKKYFDGHGYQIQGERCKLYISNSDYILIDKINEIIDKLNEMGDK